MKIFALAAAAAILAGPAMADTAWYATDLRDHTPKCTPLSVIAKRTHVPPFFATNPRYWVAAVTRLGVPMVSFEEKTNMAIATDKDGRVWPFFRGRDACLAGAAYIYRR